MEPILEDEDECGRAASVLAAGNSENFVIMGEAKTVERMDAPKGCYLDKKQRTEMKVKFNTEAGELNPEMILKHRPICRGRFYASGNTPEDCGARTITNADDCKKAADALGYEYGGKCATNSESGSDGDTCNRFRPDGCIFRLVKHSGGKDDHLHKVVSWNQGKNHKYPPHAIEDRKKMTDENGKKLWRPVKVLCQAMGTPISDVDERDLYCETTGKQECSQCDGLLDK